jgi:hypothetical protein
MAKQVTSQDIVPLLDKMSDEEIEAAADELHAFVAHRRNAAKSPTGAAKAPFNAAKFFQNFLKVVQAIYPIIAPLIGGQPGTQPPQSNP